MKIYLLSGLKRSAFTLIELIIIVGVVVVLGSLVLIMINPAGIFARTRDAQRTKNLSDIDEAIRKYIIEGGLTGPARKLEDFSGYSALLASAQSSGGGTCNGGRFGNNLTSVSGAYSITNVDGSNQINISPLIAGNYLPQLLKDPSGNLYKACIDTSSNNYLVIYSPVVETSSSVVFIPILTQNGNSVVANSYISNPSAELSTSPWACSDNISSCTLTKTTAEHAYGNASFQLTSGSLGNVGIMYGSRSPIGNFGLSASSNTPFCWSASVKTITGQFYGGFISIAMYDGSGNNVYSGQSQVTIANTGTWQRISHCSITTNNAVTMELKAFIQQSNGTVYFDGFLFEPNATSPGTYTELSSVTPTPTSTIAPTNTPTPTPSGVNSCIVTMTFRTVWSTGYSVDLTIANNTGANITGWTLNWTMPVNHGYSSGWNGNFSVAGQNLTITDAGFNNFIASGGNLTGVGYNGTTVNSDTTKPSVIYLNGTACSVN